MNSIVPVLAVLVSLAAVPMIILSRSENVREGWSLVSAIAKFLLVASMIGPVLQGQSLVFRVAEVSPGLAISLKVDAMGLLFGLVASLLWIVTSFYSIGYMRGLGEHGQTRYYCFFAVALSSTLGVAFSANLLTLYLFYELLSFATYPLVTHHQDHEARSAGRRYLVYIVGGSIGLVLPAMLICYGAVHTLDFAPDGILAQAGFSKTQLTVILLMFLFGFTKAAIMPLHGWLPAAMVAPTPVSALLHAVAVVKVGVFSILRVMTEIFGLETLARFDLGELVGIASGTTVLLASLIAMIQDDLKRRLAFSTVSQLSYIILGASLLTPAGVAAGLLHMAMHAFAKITLFFCAGAIFVSTGVKFISQMAGIGRRMPLTMGMFFIGSLGLIGLPPTGAFWSKWSLLLASVGKEAYIMLAIFLGSSLLNACYFLPIVYRAFFCPEQRACFNGPPSEAPLWCVIPPAITAAISLGLFFYPDLFLELARRAMRGN